MVVYAEREPMNPEKLKTFKKGEGTGMEGGWRSNCMSRRRRDKGRGRLAGGRGDGGEIF